MTGFNVDLGQLGAIGSKISGVGESLNSAVKTLTGTPAGDLGSDALNQAVTQLVQDTGKDIGDLASKAAGIAGNLAKTAAGYQATDQQNATNLANTGKK